MLGSPYRVFLLRSAAITGATLGAINYLLRVQPAKGYFSTTPSTLRVHPAIGAERQKGDRLCIGGRPFCLRARSAETLVGALDSWPWSGIGVG
jgi:hypothetical protein